MINQIKNKTHMFYFIIIFLIANFFGLMWLSLGFFDFDTLLDILIPLKNHADPTVHFFSPLLPIILKFLNGYFDILNVLIILGYFTIFSVLLLMYLILFRITENKFLSAIISILSILTFSFIYTSLQLDDNMFQVPFILLSFYLFLFADENNLKLFLSGLIMGIALSIHIQAIVFVPIIILAPICYSNYTVRQRIIKSICALSGLIFLVVPVIIWYMITNKFSNINIQYYSLNSNWSFMAVNWSYNEIVSWIGKYVKFMYQLNVPIILTRANALGASLKLIELCVIFFLIGISLVIFYLKKENKLLFFQIIFIAAWSMSAIFNFFYEPSSTERWITAGPFLYLPFGLAVIFLIKTYVIKLIKKKKSIFIIIVLTLIFSFIFIVINNFIQIYKYSRQIPLRTNIITIIKSVPSDSILVAGYSQWFLLSYYRQSEVMYIINDPTEKHAFRISNGKFENYNLEETVAYLQNMWKKGKKVFFLQSGMSNLSTISGFNNIKLKPFKIIDNLQIYQYQ